MRYFSDSSFRAKMKIVVVVAILWMNAYQTAEAFTCPPGFISFGTSLSDTGNVAFAFPGSAGSENSPYGETFFGFNAFRFSDGRLVVDFLDLAFGYPLLSAYMETVAPDFRRGVNFAVSGATALPEAPQVPFFLGLQVLQFMRFKRSTQVAEQAAGVPYQIKTYLPDDSVFTDGLYILSFGRNDLTFAYTLQGIDPATATATLVPTIVLFIVDGIQTLYGDGARNFLVFNVPPQGCSPQYLTIFGSLNQADYDEYGCLIAYNQVIQVFNSQLKTAIDGLRSSLVGSTILYFDYYQANIAVMQDPKSYGFAADTMLEACCGVGGNYNYNPVVVCGTTGSFNNVTVSVGSCSNPNGYINWDGVHFTDAFNGVIAKLLLSGQFLDPPINFQTSCNLDFSKFTGVTFDQAYPGSYIIVPPMSG
ncbi:unnamed protein product [Calypogeia fissa]